MQSSAYNQYREWPATAALIGSAFIESLRYHISPRNFLRPKPSESHLVLIALVLQVEEGKAFILSSFFNAV